VLRCPILFFTVVMKKLFALVTAILFAGAMWADEPGGAPDTIPADTLILLDSIPLSFPHAMVDNGHFRRDQTTDLILYTFEKFDEQGAPAEDGDYFLLDFAPVDPNDISGTYTFADGNLDLDYSYLVRFSGTDTAYIEFIDAVMAVQVMQKFEEEDVATIVMAFEGIGDDSIFYSLYITKPMLLYYDFVVEDDAVENTTTPKATYKFLEGGSVVVKKNGKTYSVNGQRVQ